MNKRQLLKAARDAGLPDPMVFYASIERFAKLVIEIEQVGDADAMTAAHMIGFDAGVKAERERCAKLCESIAAISDCTLVSKARKEAATNAATGCAKLIRTTEGRK